MAVPGVEPPDLAVLLDVPGGRLEVHYQPVVVLPGRHVVGFEALARVRRPDGVLLPPKAFVPAAERSGRIVPIGAAVLREAVAAAAAWGAANGPVATATVSVNVAPAQLLQPGFDRFVQRVLAEHGLPASALILEITESTVTSPQVRPVLHRLAQAGVRSALDDFGVGFATLENLRRLPVHLLKLDASFVAGVTREGADRAIVRVVIDLADRLGLSVIAEGVETEEQAQILARLGCPAAQGHLFARPHPDPVLAAAQVTTTHPEPDHRDDEPPLWSSDVDSAVLGAVRWLADGEDRHRAAVHTVALALARDHGLAPTSTRLVGRLALVHDLARLAVDAGLPASLRAEPLLAALVGPAGSGDEVALVRRAVAVADEALRRDPALDVATVAEVLRDQGLPAVAGSLVPVPSLRDLLEDVDRRRLGRRGMEERVRSLVVITRVLSSGGDALELLTAGLEEVRRIVGAASASLERWERDSGHLRTLLNVGQLGPGEVPVPTDEVYPLAEYAQPRRTLLSGLPYLYTVDDADADVEAVALLNQLRKYSSAAVPLHLDGRVWGQLWLTTDIGDPPFRAADVEMLTAVATLMSVVVAQAESLDRMARLAFEDPLTGVGNRRSVDDDLERLAAADVPTTVLLVDVDRLKQINDTLGHAGGDRALIRVADTLSHELPLLPGATMGRLGGDEFCVVAPRCPAPQARAWVQGVQRLLQDRWRGPGLSAGVASATPPWHPRDLLAVADADLYHAKGSRDPGDSAPTPSVEPPPRRE